MSTAETTDSHARQSGGTCLFLEEWPKYALQNEYTQLTYKHTHTHDRAHNPFCLFWYLGTLPPLFGLTQWGERNGRSPWQPCVPFCYSCDVCGDTFDPLMNSIMQERCRVWIDPLTTLPILSLWRTPHSMCTVYMLYMAREP